MSHGCAGGLLGRLQARVLQRLLAVGVQYVLVEVAEVEVKYCQVAASFLASCGALRLPAGTAPAARAGSLAAFLFIL
jgi:hypothetical protein